MTTYRCLSHLLLCHWLLKSIYNFSGALYIALKLKKRVVPLQFLRDKLGRFTLKVTAAIDYYYKLGWSLPIRASDRRILVYPQKLGKDISDKLVGQNSKLRL